jgi:hypothetical protein
MTCRAGIEAERGWTLCPLLMHLDTAGVIAGIHAELVEFRINRGECRNGRSADQ